MRPFTPLWLIMSIHRECIIERNDTFTRKTRKLCHASSPERGVFVSIMVPAITTAWPSPLHRILLHILPFACLPPTLQSPLQHQPPLLRSTPLTGSIPFQVPQPAYMAQTPQPIPTTPAAMAIQPAVPAKAASTGCILIPAALLVRLLSTATAAEMTARLTEV